MSRPAHPQGRGVRSRAVEIEYAFARRAGFPTLPMARPPSTPAAASSAAASSAPGAEALPDSYEDAMAELEQLVARMESGALPLEQLLVAYQRGASLLGFCRERLQAVEDQVKQLEDGQLKPWDAA